MPTVERRRIIELRAREQFEASRAADASEHPALRERAEMMLDQLTFQRDHLVELARNGQLKSGSTPEMEAGTVTQMANGARVVDRDAGGACSKLGDGIGGWQPPS